MLSSSRKSLLSVALAAAFRPLSVSAATASVPEDIGLAATFDASLRSSEGRGRWTLHRPAPPIHAGLEKPDLVAKFLHPSCMSLKDQSSLKFAAAREKFARHATDTGSAEVQVAALTARINHLTEHMQTYRKDFHSRRGLVGLIERRKKHLKYLRRTDFERYGALISALGIADKPFSEPRYFK